MIGVSFLATSPLPFALITVTGADGMLLEVTRSPAGAAGPTVRGTPQTADGATVYLFDLEYPPGAASIVWTATVRDPVTGAVVSRESTSPTVPPTLPPGHMLVDPLRALSVIVDAYTETGGTTADRGELLYVAGRARPVAVNEVRGGLQWQLGFETGDRAQWQRVHDILAPGRPILVQPTRDCWVLAGWVQPTSVEFERPEVPGARRAWEVGFVEVDPLDPGLVAVLATLADYAEWVPTTLGDLALQAGSLLDLSAGVIEWVSGGGG